MDSRELDARIMALIKQRNDALDREAALSGRLAYLEQYVKELEEKLKEKE